MFSLSSAFSGKDDFIRAIVINLVASEAQSAAAQPATRLAADSRYDFDVKFQIGF